MARPTKKISGGSAVRLSEQSTRIKRTSPVRDIVRTDDDEQEESSDISPLTAAQQRRRISLEGDVRRGMTTIAQASTQTARALTELHEQRLYRSTHRQWSAYIRDTFGLTRQRAYQLVGEGLTLKALDAAERQPALSDGKVKNVRSFDISVAAKTPIAEPSGPVRRELAPVARKQPEKVAPILEESRRRSQKANPPPAVIQEVIREQAPEAAKPAAKLNWEAFERSVTSVLAYPEADYVAAAEGMHAREALVERLYQFVARLRTALHERATAPNGEVKRQSVPKEYSARKAKRA